MKECKQVRNKEEKEKKHGRKKERNDDKQKGGKEEGFGKKWERQKCDYNLLPFIKLAEANTIFAEKGFKRGRINR